MRKINEYGRSMTEMLGVLAIIGVLSMGGVAGYSKAMYKYNIQKTVSFVSDALLEYNLFLKKDIGAYVVSRDEMAQKARDYALISDCEPEDSSLGGSAYQVCHAPLGEIYPRLYSTKLDEGRQYTYMLYVTLLKNRRQACADFLTKGWDRIVPDKFWRRGRIWIVSNTNDEIVYGGGVNSLDVTGAANACERVCGESSSYCSVVFDLVSIKY